MIEAPLLSTRRRLDEPGRWTSLLGWAIRRRVLRGALRHLAERALSGIGLDIEVEGVKLRCYLGDNATERDISSEASMHPKSASCLSWRITSPAMSLSMSVPIVASSRALQPSGSDRQGGWLPLSQCRQ